MLTYEEVIGVLEAEKRKHDRNADAATSVSCEVMCRFQSLGVEGAIVALQRHQIVSSLTTKEEVDRQFAELKAERAKREEVADGSLGY